MLQNSLDALRGDQNASANAHDADSLLCDAVVDRAHTHAEGLSGFCLGKAPTDDLFSGLLNGSGKGQTEEGETGAAHVIRTTGYLSSDTESTVLLDFVVAVDVFNRCGHSSCEAPIAPFRLWNRRTPFPLRQKAPKALHSK
jgi:hypothetical protein